MPGENQPTTPAEVTAYIGRILRRKRDLIETLRSAELDARANRRAADKVEAHAFLNASGSIPARKAQLDGDTTVEQYRADADVAEVMVDYLRRMVRQCSDEIDGARTAAASIRAEFSVLHLSDE